MLGLKIEFKLVIWGNSCHISFGCGHFLLISASDFDNLYSGLLPIGQVTYKSYFPRKENLLVPDYWMGLFASPA